MQSYLFVIINNTKLVMNGYMIVSPILNLIRPAKSAKIIHFSKQKTTNLSIYVWLPGHLVYFNFSLRTSLMLFSTCSDSITQSALDIIITLWESSRTKKSFCVPYDSVPSFSIICVPAGISMISNWRPITLS